MSFNYSVSVRGSIMPKETIVKQIEILKKYGSVLTEHLGSDNTKVVGMGKSDRDIYEADLELLKNADYIVADITVPSHRVGFMIAKALSEKKYGRILCVYNKNLCHKLSAMINGCPGIKIMPYEILEGTNYSFDNCVRRFLAGQICGRKIFLCGPPGSGKSTIAEKVSENYGLANISTGRILRDLVKDTNNPLAQTINSYMSEGKLVPDELMQDIVSKALVDKLCLKYGFVLDGYPPSQGDLQNLQRYDIYPDLVFYFECSDEIAIKRQCNRSDRVTDTIEKATERIKVYHEGVPDYKTICNKWFPNCPVIRIDAEENSESVLNTVLSTILDIEPFYKSASYFPIKPFRNNLNSGKFHFYIDSNNHEALSNILYGIYTSCPELHGQIKMNPIEYLKLGSQIKNFEIYKTMINFYEIDSSMDEVFATGRLGETIEPDLIRRILSTLENNGPKKRCQFVTQFIKPYDQNDKYMFEIKQFIGSWTLKDNRLIEDDCDTTELKFDTECYTTFDKYLLPKIPPFELHLAFDISKDKCKKLPIDLEYLNKRCQETGFNNGGWFIFKNYKYWEYRTNEFSFEDRHHAEKRVKSQAFALQEILSAHGFGNIKISLSLEIVHGIWIFNH